MFTRPRELKDNVSYGHSEALNCQINKTTSSDPSMRETIDVLMGEHQWASVTYAHVANKDPAPPVTKPCVDRHKALVNCMEQFDPNESFETYLQCIERRLRMPSGYVAHRSETTRVSTGNRRPTTAGQRASAGTLFGVPPGRATLSMHSRARGRLIGRVRAATVRTSTQSQATGVWRPGVSTTNRPCPVVSTGRPSRSNGRGRHASAALGRGSGHAVRGGGPPLASEDQGSSPPVIAFDDSQSPSAGNIRSLFGIW